jgi:choline dehydrogenase
MIAGDALVDRVLIGPDGAARGVAVSVGGGAPQQVASPLVILCGGAYCTPTVLLRSGVGPAAQLRALGIDVAHDLPGVGENLHDQPFAMLRFAGSPQMAAAMDAAVAAGWAPDEQVLAKAASRFEREAFDLHLLPYSPTHLHDGWSWHAGASALRPRSRGHVRLTSRDPEAKPLIDHRFLSDPGGEDVAMLRDGIALVRELAASLGAVVGRELAPGPDVSEAALEAWLRARPDSYWHPVGTAKMGPASDPLAVCDERGEVRGLPGCRVADAALMPSVPRAATAMPVTVIGERIAASILAERM